MKLFCWIGLCLFCMNVLAQNPATAIGAAIAQMEKDNSLRHALIGLHIVDAKSGKIIFSKNGEIGMAPASTQKVITSATSFEMLGADFRYKTYLALEGTLTNGVLNGNLHILGSGDPTLGSWRWKETGEAAVKKKIADMLREKNIKTIKGNVVINTGNWETQATPNGWIWEDIGNYYGAGSWGINWHENQYNLVLKPGKNAGEPVRILRTDPHLTVDTLLNELTTGKAGSGDNSIIYLPERTGIGVVRGTVPAGVDNFVVKGSVPNAPVLFASVLKDVLSEQSISVQGNVLIDESKAGAEPYKKWQILDSLVSPAFTQMNANFMDESINLYGESFLKTLGYLKTGFASTLAGVNATRDFWLTQNIDKSAVKIMDGSGLSPGNRVTPAAMVQVLMYVRRQNWFETYYDALPVNNGIHMKSGYISGVRAYAGFVTSKSGTEYCFDFVINNFDGSASAVREKMYKVLDLLK